MNLTKKHLAITLAIGILLNHTVQAQTPLPISEGGTGSTTQNFVDLTTAQTISGNKTFLNSVQINKINSSTQYNLSSFRFLSSPSLVNTFLGINTGMANTTGRDNVFVGYKAGLANTTGARNTLLGFQAGLANTTGGYNVFAGADAGGSNTTGGANVFIGEYAGQYHRGNECRFWPHLGHQ